MFFVLIFPLLVMYFYLMRCVFRLPSRTRLAQPGAYSGVPLISPSVADGVAQAAGTLGVTGSRDERVSVTPSTRRSTRINHAIQVKITAIDSVDGLCSEEVAADTVSCHGFAFKWKYDVPVDSKVVLELRDGTRKGQPVFARGVVKWHQRPGLDQGDLFHAAIQLEKPGNIWKVASPPEDWLPFCQPQYLVPAEGRELVSGYVS